MSPDARLLLIVEDDEAIAQGLALTLGLEGFRTEVCDDGAEALATIERLAPTVVLLDLSLPNKTGLDVLAELREGGDDTPVVVLSARQNESDKVAALRLGADDYVTKPFGVAELSARIEAVLRRVVPGSTAPAAERLRFGTVEIDDDRREVFRDGEPVPMTRLEFNLLRFFVAHPEKVFDRHRLMNEVWGIDHDGSPRTVDNFVGQLRQKLEVDPNRPRHLVTVRGSGYRFDP